MSDRTVIEIKLYSPRWGTNDTYEFQFEKEQMKVKKMGGPSEAICTWYERKDPEWNKLPNSSKNPLIEILENDNIFPPTVFIRAIVYAWMAWRNSEINDEQIQSEMNELAKWQNLISENKPKTKFWLGKF